MTVSTKRTAVGSITVVRTKAFICGISSLPGLFRGSVAVMRANADGEIVKWPLVGKAYFQRGMTKEQRDVVHDYISKGMDDLGGNEVNVLGSKQFITLSNAM